MSNVRDFSQHLAKHQRMMRGIASKFHRSSLCDDDLQQEALIALWETLSLPATAPKHVAAGQKTYADLPEQDLTPLLYRALRHRLITVVRREEAKQRDYRLAVPLDDAPESVDEHLNIEQAVVQHESLVEETSDMDAVMTEAFRLMSDDEAVVAFELLYPRPAETVPGVGARAVDSRSSYSIAAILGCSRDRARTLICNVRAAFAIAGVDVGRDWAGLVRA